MSKIVAKTFDAAKRVMRAVFMGSPNLFTTSDVNRQIDAFKYQLDQLDDKVGLLSDIETTVSVNGGILEILPTYTTIKNRGAEFSGITGLTSGQLLTKNNIVDGNYYLCVAANSELVAHGDDPSHEISGAKFEDGSAKPAANHYVIRSASFRIYNEAELSAAKSTYEILFVIIRVEVAEGAFSVVKYYTEGIEDSAISISRKAENTSKNALLVARNATEVCREVATEVSSEAKEIAQEANATANRLFPLGGITMWGGSTEAEKIPEGFHLCDGSHINVSDEIYTKWAQMGYQVGSHPAIVLPDLRGKFIVGYDSRNTAQEAHDINEDYDQVGKTGGSQDVTLTAAQSGLPTHKHTASSSIKANSQGKYGGEHRHKWFGDDQIETFVQAIGGSKIQDMSGYDAGSDLSSENRSRVYGTSQDGDHTHTIETTINNVDSANAAEAHENRPPYYVIAYIIRIS